MAEIVVHYRGPVLAREEASQAGLTRFFTGKPCNKSHLAQRMVSNRSCVECMRAQRHKDRDKIRARYDRNIEKYRAKDRERRARNRKKYRDLHRNAAARRRSIAAGRPKPSVCDLCRGKGGKQGISFDHCHATGAFRGWLCGNCNRALGLANEAPALLRRMARYLEKSRAQD